MDVGGSTGGKGGKDGIVFKIASCDNNGILGIVSIVDLIEGIP